MTSIFDKLNLRPNERRLVIIVAIVVFIVLNWIFVWPHFGDWGRIQRRQAEANELLRRYRIEVDNTGRYQRTMAELEKAGAAVASEDQALKLANTVQNQALLSGVQWNGYNPGRASAASGKPNQFFEEQSGTMSFTADEKALIDFLYSLGTGGSMIRVRTMTLNPDPQRYKLAGNLTLVASYAKKAPPKVVAAAATTTTPTGRSTNAGPKSGSPFTKTPTNTPTKK